MSTRWIGLFVAVLASTAQGDDWPQWRGPKRDGVWREDGIVDKVPKKLEFVWRTPLGLGYAGPAVAGRRIFVMDRELAQGQRNPGNPFSRNAVGGNERVVCLDFDTGKVIWKHEYPCRYTISYPSGPRVTPTVADGKVYAIGAMGDMVCLDAETGKTIWSKNFVRDFGATVNTWGYSASPLVDGDNLIAVAGGEKAGVVALNKNTGATVWKALEFADFGYCPPMIFEFGGRRQLIVWSPIALHSLDPKDGTIFWEQPFRVKAGMTIATPVLDGDRLFVTAFYSGPMMMKLAADAPKAEVLWKGNSESEIKTDGLHAVMCTPVAVNGHIYGVCSYGQFRCLEAATGKRVWESLKPTGMGRWWNAFIVPQGDRYFIHNEQGELLSAKLSPKGFEETGRAFLIEPTNKANNRKVVWSHPAFAHRSVVARNDKEIVRVDLAAK